MKSNKFYIRTEQIQNIQEDEDEPIFSSNNNIKRKYKKSRKGNKISLLKKYLAYILFISIIIIFVIISISYLIIYYQASKNIKLLLKYQSTENPLNKINIINEIKSTKINTNKERIGVAFAFGAIFGNGIGRMLSVLCNELVKLDKYDIYLITAKSNKLDYHLDERVKRVEILRNKTLLENFDKTSNIKIYAIQNQLTPQNINWYKSLNGGKKVINIVHGAYLANIYSNETDIYRIYKYVLLSDAYVQVVADDNYANEKLGFNNSFFIPNLYTFDPDKTPDSNLTYKNIVILGRMFDAIKGGVYGIKAMKLIVEKIPDAKLYLITSTQVESLNDLIKELDLTKNIEIIYSASNITHYFLNSSVFLFPSLSEAYPMAVNEAKAHGLPIVAFNISYSPPYQNGVILCENLNYTHLAEESIKLLEDYEYRKKKGREAKESLKDYSNKEIIGRWDKLFEVLINEDPNEFKKLRKYTFEKYYDEEKAREHLETNFNAGKKYNPYFCCHNFNDLLNITYINNIKGCKNRSLCK